MADTPNPNNPQNLPSSSSEIRNSNSKPNFTANADFSGQRANFPNPPDAANPDPATLRDQWRYAIRQYSKWYSHAWGTAILAGVSFFALGWIIKGSNPIPSFKTDNPSSSPNEDTDEARR